jgi:hypothetical protein
MGSQNPDQLAYAGSIGSASDRDFYGTPSKWVKICRKVMGSIALDPASCKEANAAVVKAARFFDKSMNALSREWLADTVFLNPPYGRKTLPAFAAKFQKEMEAGHIKQAIVLINNCTDTKAFEAFSACASARAEPRKRIQFVSVEGRCNERRNTRGQVFFYYGRRTKRFASEFQAAGCRVLQEIK